MRFKCKKCEREFMYPAKMTERIMRIEDETVIDQEHIPVESSVCPYCFKKDFDELPHPPEAKPEITSVKSVSLEEVDSWLKEGYVVESLYAKTATLVKREQPKEEKKGDYVDELVEKHKNGKFNADFESSKKQYFKEEFSEGEEKEE